MSELSSEALLIHLAGLEKKKKETFFEAVLTLQQAAL